MTVVGHDFEVFARESERMRGPVELSMAFVNPFWRPYNERLIDIMQLGKPRARLLRRDRAILCRKTDEIWW